MSLFPIHVHHLATSAQPSGQTTGQTTGQSGQSSDGEALLTSGAVGALGRAVARAAGAGAAAELRDALAPGGSGYEPLSVLLLFFIFLALTLLFFFFLALKPGDE